MALKADRYEEATDISHFSSTTGVRGQVVCLDSDALAGASGAALDQGENTVSPQAAAVGDVPVGIILNDVVDKDLTRTHLNQYKDEVSQHEVAKDDIFKTAYDSWQKDEAQLDAILLEHGFNTQDAIVNMHKGGYAGTMTGVTAGRLAQRSTQEAGRAISKSLA